MQQAVYIPLFFAPNMFNILCFIQDLNPPPTTHIYDKLSKIYDVIQQTFVTFTRALECVFVFAECFQPYNLIHTPLRNPSPSPHYSKNCLVLLLPKALRGINSNSISKYNRSKHSRPSCLSVLVFILGILFAVFNQTIILKYLLY